MSVNSTLPRRRRKRTDRPDKPYPEFPLQIHASGHWSKRIRGRLCYFGKWANRESGELITLPDGGNWKAALARYKAEIDDLRAGRIPRARAGDSDRVTLADLCNRFLTSKKRQLDAHELSPRAFHEYGEACDLMIDHFGKQRLGRDVLPEDFESLRAAMAKRWGLARRGKFIQLVRSAFKHGMDNGLIKQPILFGSTFKKPSKAVMRKHKAAGGKKLFSVTEIQLMIDALDGKELDVIRKSEKPSKLKLPANPQLKAIVLLALNGGLGNADVSGLQFSHLDLDGKWIDYPRPKTGLKRRIPLWKETIAALRCHIAKRRAAKHNDDKDCVFLNRAGRRMVQEHVTYIDDDINVWCQDYVSSQFRSLLVMLKINGRKGLNFYSIRHTFATVGLQTGDRDAVQALMGQAENDVLSAYDETGPSDQRLRVVTQHVHDWLFTTLGTK